jgi:hypothetical protein
MRITGAAVFVMSLAATAPLAAQGRGRSNGIPPGHLPPPGECRVWYDGRPPGHQPPPTDCRQAERIAARDRSARVIYGGDVGRRDGDRRDRYPARSPYPTGRYPGGRAGSPYADVAFDNGYNDGLDKGREDARDNERYDPVRHSRYRSADRGYNNRHGSREEYRDIYREGFRDGYDAGYRDANVSRGDNRRGGVRLPWPF